MVGDKYRRLGAYLASQPGHQITLSFKQIEEIIQAKLPASAIKHQAWWSAEVPRRSQETAWLEAGWKVARADRERRFVTFERV